MVETINVFDARDGADLVDIIRKDRARINNILDSRFDRHGHERRDAQITIHNLAARLGRTGDNVYSVTFLYPSNKLNLLEREAKFLDLAKKYSLLCEPVNDTTGLHLFCFYTEIKKLFRKSEKGKYVSWATSNSVQLDITFEKAREFAKDIFDLYLQAQQ